MKVIELFSGNADITKYLRSKGIYCVSVDYDINKKPDICVDVYTLAKENLKEADFIWLSPDCTTYSFASHGLHRIKGGVPVSQYAVECDINNRQLFKMLQELDIPFICENPRCHFRQMPFVQGLHRITIYYSTYGMPYTKPTDLFSNRKELLEHFDTRYIRGQIHLDYVKGYNDFLGRCKMPERLIEDIYKAIKGLDNEKEN